MNIQSVVQQLNNLINSAQNTDAAKQEAVPASETAQAAPAQSVPADIKMASKDEVNALLKELADKLGSAQKALDSMPQSLKDAIRQLFSDKTAVTDLSGGLSNLLQGQKDVASNLHKLAETLSTIAEFLNEASPEEAAAKEAVKQKLPQLPNMPITKEAVAEKLDAQLIKKLLESISTKDGAAIVKQLQTLGQNGETEEAALPQDGKAPAQTETRQQAPMPGENMAKPEEAAPKNADKQATAQEQPKGADTRPTEQKAAPTPMPQREQGTTINSQTLRQQGTQQKHTGEQPLKAETEVPAAKNSTVDFFRNATVVKGLSEVVGKDSLAELVHILKETPVKGEEVKSQEAGKQAPPAQGEAKPKEGGNLLSLVKENLPAVKAGPEVKPQDIARFMETMQKLGGEIEKQSAQKPELARAWQTLSENPDNLSAGDKAVLHSLLANMIKDIVKKPDDFSLLQKALQRLAGKEGIFQDDGMSELEAFNKLVKNSESLQYSKQQVETWANSLRDIAAGLARTTQLPGDKSMQHIQSSFVFYLAPDGQEKNQPVYLNIYHEKEDSGSGGGAKNAETWLRINTTPEHTGTVTAIFHLYQENLLDVRVVFENPEGMKEFSRFVPEIEQALEMTDMRLNSILVV